MRDRCRLYLFLALASLFLCATPLAVASSNSSGLSVAGQPSGASGHRFDAWGRIRNPRVKSTVAGMVDEPVGGAFYASSPKLLNQVNSVESLIQGAGLLRLSCQTVQRCSIIFQN